MELRDVFEKVKMIIVDSCGIDEKDINMDSTLFDDLSIDSIDMVDILYNLETEYNISLKIGDFDREARKELGGEPYEIDNIITPGGLEVLRRRMPEIPQEKLQPGITISEFMRLIIVQSLCNLVLQKVEEKNNAK